ncbi:MAG TPA: hypothetical protein VF595_07505 [Tepidisphaeraceae bacterium]
MTEGRRYVVLHHTGYGQPHFDLMLETDTIGPLLTWRLSEWPPADGGVAAIPLPPHRRTYLTFEGPVSGGRGDVRRVESGTYDTIEVSASAVRIVLGDQSFTLPKVTKA